MSLAWHIGVLARPDKVAPRKYPKLKEMLAGDKPQPRQQTWQEQLAIAQQWTAALSRK